MDNYERLFMEVAREDVESCIESLHKRRLYVCQFAPMNDLYLIEARPFGEKIDLISVEDFYHHPDVTWLVQCNVTDKYGRRVLSAVKKSSAYSIYVFVMTESNLLRSKGRWIDVEPDEPLVYLKDYPRSWEHDVPT